MRHIEMHLAETERDAESLEHIGLIEFGAEEYCEHCIEPVAFVYGEFEPCVVVLDEDSTFILCESCATPALNPGSEPI